MSLYPLDLPTELLEEVREVAQANQLSIEQWFLEAIAQRLAAEKTQRLFQDYARQADFDRFDQILSRVPEEVPMLGDELL